MGQDQGVTRRAALGMGAAAAAATMFAVKEAGAAQDGPVSSDCWMGRGI